MKLDDWSIIDEYIQGWSFERVVDLAQLDGNVSLAVKLREQVGWASLHASTKDKAVIVLLHDPVELDGLQCLYFPDAKSDIYYNLVLDRGSSFYYVHSVAYENKWSMLFLNDLLATDFPSSIDADYPPEFVRLISKNLKKASR
jgi:hypothetical protein